jgi:hypothetical protein
VLQRKHLLG